MNEKKTPWISIYIATACSFQHTFQFGIFFASMWPYLQILKPGVTESTFGMLVSVFSVCTFIAYPSFTLWNCKAEAVRLPMIFGLMLMIMGNLLYFSVEFLPFECITVLMIARGLLGLGSGNASILSAYVATVSRSEDLDRAIALVTSGASLGYICGPAIQILFYPLGREGIIIPFTSGWAIHMYNAPALFAAISNLSGIFFLKTFFNEKSYRQALQDTVNEEKYELDDTKEKFPKIVFSTVVLCMVTRFVQTVMISTTETVIPSYSMLVFGWDKDKTVFRNALIHSGIGVASLVFYTLYSSCKWLRWNSHPHLIVYSLASFALFYGLIMPWKMNDETETLPSCSVSQHVWCAGLPYISPEFFFTSFYILLSLPYCFITIASSTYVSLLIPKSRQSVFQSVYGACAGLATMSGPAFISFAYTAGGPFPTFGIILCLLLLVFSTWILLFPILPKPPGKALIDCVSSHSDA